ncbi:hypothetical protein KVT40_005060 [Elsinoe batatas]|uniref:EDC4-like protein pdc1 beta-propeller domain-containing protein n=1 Tax=Elsinoe batatas TaxID=2601811 RepID=A0A8K0L1W3_9PEZI|nr:hypothetical protein KVT40_005060 [Elsinoe batatas]
MADLQELFSRLKSSSSASQQNSQSSQSPLPPFSHLQAGYQQPSVSSPIFSPPIHTPNPAGSGILSPKLQTPSQDAKAANLLNLLRFNGQSQQPSALNDLQNVANTSKSLDTPSHAAGLAPQAELPSRGATSPASNPQSFLLNLLNQPRKASEQPSTPLEAPQPRPLGTGQPELVNNLAEQSPAFNNEAKKPASREATPVRVCGSAKSRETTPFEIPSGRKGNGMFTYVNPFESLSASTPKKSTPKPEAAPQVPPAAATATAAPVQPEVPQESSGSKKQKVKDDITATAPVAPSIPAIKQEDSVPDSWQTATDSAGVVQVFNFPMKPFVSIKFRPRPAGTTFRSDIIMDIVRLKKDFDQIDRTLATATETHIAYAMSKSGGFRVIRQDSGRDKQVFKNSQERTFHIQIRDSREKSPADTILATGVNGSVFWTKVDASLDDKWEDQNLEAKGFILPAVNAQEENTSGSPVKTRTKMSNRHSDIFAISRGKSIHIITPEIAGAAKYADAKTRIVNIEKYYQERNLKITTGKACKDFTFSEDDSTIASLDKAGRIRFWDMKDISEAARNGKKVSLELKNPLLTFTATLASEKISPTSIMFLDKERPCVKGVALRYLLVGFKQNHLLQLWDLGLGRPVQELHFPHDSDADAICSINYHPKTGIIALAHPTRNSVFFIHLSAPRYTVPNMDQATYISKLANEDPLPKPEATAIMSGVREISFGAKGQLRSIDMLNNPAASEAEKEETLFELYAMHSTGVTCVSIKKADLGWGPDNNILSAVDAEEADLISVSPMPDPNSAPTVVDTPAKTKLTPKEETVKRAVSPQPKTKVTPPEPTIGVIKQSIEIPAPAPSAVNPPILTPESYVVAAPRPASMSLPEAVIPEPKPSPVEKQTSLPDRAKKSLPNGDSVGADSAAQITRLITSELETLYKRIEDNRRVQDIAASTRQQGVLELISTTLTDNVERSLASIVSTSIQQEVLPAVTDVFAAMAERRLAEYVHESVGTVVPREVRQALPSALATALRDPETTKLMAGPISAELSQKVLATMEGVVRKTIAPTISQTITASVQQAMSDSEARFSSQRADNDAKFDRLANLIFGLSETLQRVTTSQSALQDQVFSLQRQLENTRQSSRPSTASANRAPIPVPQDPELEEITELMQAQVFEDATIKWLQSPRQALLFDQLFVRVNPQYLQKLSPLVKLSVSAAVSTSFEQNVEERLNWLDHILSSTDLQDQEIVQVAPKIMNVLLGRIQGAYMMFAEKDVNDPILRKFSGLSKRIGEMGRAV